MASTRLHVSASNLRPAQQRTPVGLLRSVDGYLLRGVKFPHIAVCHSYAEFVHHLLLEGEPPVTHWVPQAFRLRLGKRYYTPDVYLFRNGRHVVREIKAEAQREEWGATNEARLQQFFSFHDMTFEVVSNQAVLEQERLAMHLLPIIQTVSQAGDHNTYNQEQTVYTRLQLEERLPFHAFVDPTNRTAHADIELALFRLLLRGKIHADLAHAPLDYDTEFSL